MIIFVAQYLFVLPILVFTWLILTIQYKSRIALVVSGISGGIVCLLLAKLGNHYIIDPRPFIRDGVTALFKSSIDNGFPSDHTLLSFFLSFLIVRFSRNIGIVLIVISLLIGWARVYSGVHHFYDVLGSLVISVLGVTVGMAFQKAVKINEK